MTKLNDVFLMVVGEFYESQELYRELIHQLGIDDRVRIVDDYVPNDSVPLYFSAADAVVLPYLSATQSGIIQVAYQFNKPVIATRVGGLTEVVDDGRTGILVPSGDPDALADGINRFFAGGGEQKMSAEVERAKRSYSWEAMTTAIETLGGSRA
jgi:glycosyltransferase involved in cell wall biosynthesis